MIGRQPLLGFGKSLIRPCFIDSINSPELKHSSNTVKIKSLRAVQKVIFNSNDKPSGPEPPVVLDKIQSNSFKVIGFS